MGFGYGRILLGEGIEELTLVSHNNAPALRVTTPAGELAKAAGAIGCLTGVLSRERTAAGGKLRNSE